MKGIASFDMDMTLLDHDTWKIPDSASRALEKLRGQYHLVIATGRDLDSKFSAGLKELVEPDAVIHLNGTKITIGEELLYEHHMDQELVKDLIQFAQDNGLAIGITTGSADYYTNKELIIENDMMRWGKTDRIFQDPWDLLQMKVCTMTYIGQAEGARLMEQTFPQVKLPMFSSGEGADIVEREASKAEGLKRLCDYYGISIEDTIAFGDSMNDYEIIREAGIGVAMGNSIEVLKTVADHVTTPIGEDGIWNACQVLKLFEPEKK